MRPVEFRDKRRERLKIFLGWNFGYQFVDSVFVSILHESYLSSILRNSCSSRPVMCCTLILRTCATCSRKAALSFERTSAELVLSASNARTQRRRIKASTRREARSSLKCVFAVIQ